MKNMSWFQGRNLGKSENRAIRREAWRKWLVFGVALRFISKVVSGVEQRYVVPNTEFGRDEFLANDWTDEPWVDSTIPSGVTPPSTPYQPGAGGSGGIGSSGGSGSFGPPPPGGGGSGGGGGSEGGGERHCPAGYTLSADGRKCEKNPGADNTPTITVTIAQPDLSHLGSEYDKGRDCFETSGLAGGSGGGPYTADLNVSANIAGGPPGVGTLSVKLQGQTQLGTGWPGMNQDFQFPGVSFQSGSNITATADYTIDGETFNGSGDVSFPGDCPLKKKGCMDPAANNYDATAEEDDGSCTYDPPQCPAGQHWDGTACVPDDPPQCPAGQHWDGTACVPDDPPQCPAGQHWNGSTCVPDDDGSSNGSVGGGQM